MQAQDTGVTVSATQMKRVSQQGWMYAGGNWTVAIGSSRGVVETAKADFNQVFRALAGNANGWGWLCVPLSGPANCARRTQREVNRHAIPHHPDPHTGSLPH